MVYKVQSVAEIKANLKQNGALFEVVSLFAGGGGSSTGYRMAGGKVLAVNEFVEEARRTYAANWPDTPIFPQDIRELSAEQILGKIGKQPGELDILDGSPPCSAFSIAGQKEKGWGKTKKYSDVQQSNIETLFFEYVRMVEGIMPRVFVAENVAGLAKGAARGYLNEFLRAFEKAGYITRAKILNAKFLGVPQQRERLIFVGVRKDLWRKEFEGKTHPKPFKYTVSAKEAFFGMKNPEDELNFAKGPQSGKVFLEMSRLKPGEQSKKYFQMIKVHPDAIAPCITASCGRGAGGAAMHWENRRFTVSELKRLMSIPDDYILTGKKSQQGERLGRMVPPLMMKAVAENIYNNLLKEMKK